MTHHNNPSFAIEADYLHGHVARGDLTVEAMRDTAAKMRIDGIMPRPVAGGFAYQVDAPKALVATLRETKEFMEGNAAGEFMLSDLPWWGEAWPERSYVLVMVAADRESPVE